MNPKYGGLVLDKSLKENFLDYVNGKDGFPQERYDNIPVFKDFSKEQKRLSKSRSSTVEKIKGVAGAGKTLVMAQRAIDAYKRTGKKVLLLHYNISLSSHIKKVITELNGGFYNHSHFCIDTYHGFISAQKNNLGISEKQNSYTFDEDINITQFFEKYKNKLPQYDSIFIDEIQDFQNNWIENIKTNFLSEDGEFVVFGDENQGVYEETGLECISNIPWIDITGNQSFRLGEKISKLASSFQVFFYDQKNKESEIESQQKSLFTEHLTYHGMRGGDSIEMLYSIILEYTKDKSDIVIVSSGIQRLRKIKTRLDQKKQQTIATFSSQDFLDKINSSSANEIVKKARVGENERKLKAEFSLATDAIKLSTTYSFKGYEADTVICIIQSYEENDQLIYTALTRTKQNLLVINIGNKRYEEFFLKNSKIFDSKPLTFSLYELREENAELKTELQQKGLQERNAFELQETLSKKEEIFKQKKDEYLFSINALETEKENLEKELLKQNKISKLFKKDNSQVVDLKEKIKKNQAEKKKLKSEIQKKEEEIASLRDEFDERLQRQNINFLKELQGEKKKIQRQKKQNNKLKQEFEGLQEKFEIYQSLYSNTDENIDQNQDVLAGKAVRLCREIERLLQSLGGTGLGINELFISAMKNHYPEKELKDNIQLVMSYRNNRLSHNNENFEEMEVKDYEDFLKACNVSIQFLEKLI